AARRGQAGPRAVRRGAARGGLRAAADGAHRRLARARRLGRAGRRRSRRLAEPGRALAGGRARARRRDRDAGGAAGGGGAAAGGAGAAGVRPALVQLLDRLYREGTEWDAGQDDRLRRRRNLEPDAASFLRLLILTAGVRRVLEIGSSNGYSTIWLADAV